MLDGRRIYSSCVFAPYFNQVQCQKKWAGLGSRGQVAVNISPSDFLAPVGDGPGGEAAHLPGAFAPGSVTPVGELGIGTGHTVTVQVLDTDPTYFAGGAFPVLAEGSSSFRVLAARPSFIYENLLPKREITEGLGPERPLDTTRGALTVAGATTYGPSIASKYPGTKLAGQSEREMADALQRWVRQSCAPFEVKGNLGLGRIGPVCRGSGHVLVDELSPLFADWNAAQRDQQGRPGPGTRLSRAMALLDHPSPYGFRWADRIHLFLSPTVMLDIADGSPDRSYDQLAPALARAGGVWMEMYAGAPGYGARAFNADQWRTAPARVAALVARGGGSAATLHFAISRAARVEQAQDRFGKSCTLPMACQWALADETLLGRRILANGVAAYRTADQAGDWLREFNRRFNP